jgi:choline dehydrogenase-like flavoprotein
VLRPRSRGHLALRSARPHDAPMIHAGYLTQPRDTEVLLAGIEVSREIMHAGPLQKFRGRELFPGEAARTREAIEQVVRQKAETIYHPVGTCRMGNDADSVVDTELRVRGVEALRVIDASIMPRLIGGNTNAPTIMIAEKAADGLLGAAGR